MMNPAWQRGYASGYRDGREEAESMTLIGSVLLILIGAACGAFWCWIL